MLREEHGIGGDRDYFGDNDAQLGRINVFYHEASGDKYSATNKEGGNKRAGSKWLLYRGGLVPPFRAGIPKPGGALPREIGARAALGRL